MLSYINSGLVLLPISKLGGGDTDIPRIDYLQKGQP